MAVWYYSIKGQQLGPVDELQIRAMAANYQLAANDLVWRKECRNGSAPRRQA